MSKRDKRKKKQVVITPSFESPVCPTCGRANALVQEASDDDPMYECTNCWVRFMFEDSRVEIEEDDSDIVVHTHIVPPPNAARTSLNLLCAICGDKGCKACGKNQKKDKKDSVVYSTEPMFGEVEELTDAVASRS